MIHMKCQDLFSLKKKKKKKMLSAAVVTGALRVNCFAGYEYIAQDKRDIKTFFVLISSLKYFSNKIYVRNTLVGCF